MTEKDTLVNAVNTVSLSTRLQSDIAWSESLISSRTCFNVPAPMMLCSVSICHGNTVILPVTCFPECP